MPASVAVPSPGQVVKRGSIRFLRRHPAHHLGVPANLGSMADNMASRTPDLPYLMNEEEPLTGEGIRTGNYNGAPLAETFWCDSNSMYEEGPHAAEDSY